MHSVARLKISNPLLLLLTLIVTVAAYWPGLDGPFVFDDYYNFVTNQNLAIAEFSFGSIRQAALSGEAGPLGRPLSMLSFALNRFYTGLDPFPFKFVNLLIHLLNGILVFLLSRRLFLLGNVDSAHGSFLAVMATSIWLLHPMQLTSVLYVVQRMTSLSTTFVLLGLLAYLTARNSKQSPRGRVLWLWLAVPSCTALAALAKENGLLLVLFAFVIECTLMRFRWAADWRIGTPSQFFALFLALPLWAGLAFLVSEPEWLSPAANHRPFDAGERLLTEARVLLLYVKLLFVPAISNLALFYDDFTISRSLLEPPETLWAVLIVLASIVAAIGARRRAPWFSFAVLWFLVGHAMESTFILLELVHPHRNYLAYLGPMLTLTIAGYRILSHSRSWLPAAVGVCVLAALSLTTGLRAYQWRNPLDLAAFEVLHRPNSARAHYELGRLLNIAAENTGQDVLNEEAKKYLRRSAELDPGGVSGLIGVAILAKSEIPADVLSELILRLRTRALAPSSVIYLKALITCQRKRKCQTPPEQIIAVLGAALDSSRLGSRERADVLTVLGMYYAQQLSDAEACVRLMREASNLVPDDPIRLLNLAQALLFVPDYVEAGEALRRAEELDTLGVHRVRLRSVREDLVRFSAATRARSDPLSVH